MPTFWGAECHIIFNIGSIERSQNICNSISFFFQKWEKNISYEIFYSSLFQAMNASRNHSEFKGGTYEVTNIKWASIKSTYSAS